MLDESKKELIENVRRSRLMRRLYNTAYPFLLIRSMFLFFQGERNEILELFINREKRTGLLEDSIIQNPLYVPNESGLSYEEARAGRWVGYDFNRRQKFGEKSMSLKKGKFYDFPLTDVMPNDANTFTPTEHFDFFDIEHLLHMDTPTVDELIDLELLKSTTYRDSFRRVGIYEDHAKQLDDLGIANKEVYQVTPKGNGLIFLDKEGGERKPKEKISPLTIDSQAIPIPVR